MQDFIKYLQRYVSIRSEEESKIISNLTTRSYLKGQYILQAGDICRHQSHIIKGKARTFYLDKSGTEHVLMFAIENWWVADLDSFSNQMPAQFNIQCLENTDVVQIPFENYEKLLRDVPVMERFFRMIIQKAFANMSTRIIRNNAMSAKERYLLFCEQYPQMTQRVPLYMVASYLGITKEHLSSIRSEIANS